MVGYQGLPDTDAATLPSISAPGLRTERTFMKYDTMSDSGILWRQTRAVDRKLSTFLPRSSHHCAPLLSVHSAIYRARVWTLNYDACDIRKFLTGPSSLP